MNKKILIMIPAYNEEKMIVKTIKGVFKTNKKFDVLVINDGSTDRTLAEVAKTKADVISHPYNLGYGVALQTGYKYALENDYEAVVQIDADGQHDPKYIVNILEVLESKKVDVVVGSRFKSGMEYRAPLARRLGMIFFNFIVNRATGLGMTDSTSGYQAIKRIVLPFLVSEFFPCDYPDADLMIMLHFAGYRVKEMPMKMYESETGQSMHGSIIKNFYYVFKMSLSIFTVILRKYTGLPNK